MKTKVYHDQLVRIAQIYNEGPNEAYKEESITHWRYRLYNRKFEDFDTPVETALGINSVNGLDSSKVRSSPISLINKAMTEKLDGGKYSNLMNLRQLQEKTLKFLLLATDSRAEIEQAQNKL